ncbi:hypothetical protein U0070_007536, partial [Myodes glareolus]
MLDKHTAGTSENLEGKVQDQQTRGPAASATSTMARPCAFLMALVLMSYWSTCSLGCDLPQTHNLRNKGALTLLAQMRRLSPLSCLKDRKDFAFPLEKVDAQQIQEAQAIPVLQELTQQVLILFSSKDSSAAWETTLLDTFCTGLHQQLKDLQACLMQQVAVQEPPLTQEDSLDAVRKYFHKISVYLIEKKHSPCAWEVVRAEVWRALSSSAKLLSRLSEEKEPCAFLMARLLMSYWSTCSLGCDLPQTHNLRNKGALTLLAQMRRLSPLSCLKDGKDFAFPLEKVDAQQIQKTQVIPVLQELTQQVLVLFSSKDSSAAWETTLLDTFCTGLHQQLKDLQTCLMQQVGVQEPPLTQEVSLMAVWKYFHRITVYLREKKHSPCAWEVVRAEVWRALSSSAKLLSRLSEEK